MAKANRPEPFAGSVKPNAPGSKELWVAVPHARRAKPASPFHYFNLSPEVIRLVVMMHVRLRQMKTLQKFASVQANVHNHFNFERHLVDRQTCKEQRSAALSEWQTLAS